VREYRLAAAGGRGEHRAAVDGRPVQAGMHTLSLQVKPAGAAWLRVHLLDEQGDGVIADYNLAAATVTRTGLARSGIQDVDVRPGADGWLTLTQSAALRAGPSRIVIQLIGADGSGSFAPRGEAVVLRGLTLRAGEAGSAAAAAHR
jgi:hypothetical protein